MIMDNDLAVLSLRGRQASGLGTDLEGFGIVPRHADLSRLHQWVSKLLEQANLQDTLSRSFLKEEKNSTRHMK